MHRFARRAATLALALAALWSPAAARGAVYQAADSGELTAALASAHATVEADTINLAANTFVGPFSYNGSSPIEIVGAGPGLSILTTGGSYALLLQGGAVGDRVANLTATITGGTTVRGIWVGAASATVEDVTVTRSGGTNLFAIVLEGNDDVVRRATVDGAFSRSFEVQGMGATLTDITARNGAFQGVGIEVDAKLATATARRARISGMGTGVMASFSGQLTLTDSLLDMRGPAGSGIVAGDSGNSAANTSAVTADRVTVIGDAMSGYGAYVGVGTSNEADDMTIAIRDSIVSGMTVPFGCFENGAVPQGSIRVSDTASTGATTNTCADGIADAGISIVNGTTAVPGFVDATAGDFRLRWDSPLVDLGGTTPAPASTDLGGLERVVDGDGAGIATTDLGAHEYQRRAPVIGSAGADPATAAIGAPVVFSAAATDPDPLEGALLTYAWAFDDGGSATGPAASHAFASAGSHVATVTVTDPAGATAKQDVLVGVPAPAPAPAPTPAQAPSVKLPFRAAKALVFPSSKACLSRRSFAIRVRIPKGLTAKDAAVTITGRKRFVVKGRSLTAPINLRGLPKGTFKVTVTVRTTDGRKVTGTRTYRTCAPQRR